MTDEEIEYINNLVDTRVRQYHNNVVTPKLDMIAEYFTNNNERLELIVYALKSLQETKQNKEKQNDN